MSMRQRQSSLPLDEECGSDRPPSTVPPSSPTRRRGKKRRPSKSSKAQLLLFLCIPFAGLLILFLQNRQQHVTTDTALPLRRSLFQPQVGASTKCQKALLLNREKLDKSLAFGTTFLMNHQKDEGNFDYEYDWMTDINTNDDMEVRQAGALWGLSLIFHDMMDSLNDETSITSESSIVLKQTARRIMRGIGFFREHSQVLENDVGQQQVMRYLTYPGEDMHGTGTQALVCLALIDFIRGLKTPEDAAIASVTASEFEDATILLDEMLPFLVTQHSQALNIHKGRFQAYKAMVESGKQVLQSGMWNGKDKGGMVSWWQENQGPWVYGYFYDKFNKHGNRKGRASPYYDGESLLAITKAAKYLPHKYVHLWPMAAGTAQALHKLHVEDALEEDEDSDETKGVYQWLSMSLFELATVTFGQGYVERFDLPVAIESTYPQDVFGRWLVDLAVWMVDVHRTLRKERNTGYAYEGIVPAWTWASHVIERDGNAELETTARKLECTIEKGISKLISWQVGMGAEKAAEEWDGVKGLGGVQNAEDESGLRIDVTQHQMHATILTRRLVYAPRGGEEWPWNNIELPQ